MKTLLTILLTLIGVGALGQIKTDTFKWKPYTDDDFLRQEREYFEMWNQKWLNEANREWPIDTASHLAAKKKITIDTGEVIFMKPYFYNVMISDTSAVNVPLAYKDSTGWHINNAAGALDQMVRVDTEMSNHWRHQVAIRDNLLRCMYTFGGVDPRLRRDYLQALKVYWMATDQFDVSHKQDLLKLRKMLLDTTKSQQFSTTAVHSSQNFWMQLGTRPVKLENYHKQTFITPKQMIDDCLVEQRKLKNYLVLLITGAAFLLFAVVILIIALIDKTKAAEQEYDEVLVDITLDEEAPGIFINDADIRKGIACLTESELLAGYVIHRQADDTYFIALVDGGISRDPYPSLEGLIRAYPWYTFQQILA